MAFSKTHIQKAPISSATFMQMKSYTENEQALRNSLQISSSPLLLHNVCVVFLLSLNYEQNLLEYHIEVIAKSGRGARFTAPTSTIALEIRLVTV